MITSAKYTEHDSIVATIDGQKMTVPDDMTNRHRQMIAEWEAGGNTIAAYVEPTPTPEETRAAMPSLTARQLRLGLIGGGFSLSQVGNAIAAIPDEQQRAVAEIEWEYATQFNRMHPLILSVGDALGLTPEQIDAMWEAAHVT